MADVPEYEPMGSATWRPIQAGGYQGTMELFDSSKDKERLGHEESYPSSIGSLITLLAYAGLLGREADFGPLSHIFCSDGTCITDGS